MECASPLDKLSKVLRTVGRRLSSKFATTATLDYFVFLDTGREQWVLWAQFLNSERWIPIGMKEAAN